MAGVTVATRSTYTALDPIIPQILVAQAGRGAKQTATFNAAETIFDCSKGSLFQLTLTASGSILSPINPLPGQTITLLLKQDGTGSRTVTWNGQVIWPAATAPTLTTTAGRTDKIDLTWDDVTANWLGQSSLNYTN